MPNIRNEFKALLLMILVCSFDDSARAESTVMKIDESFANMDESHCKETLATFESHVATDAKGTVIHSSATASTNNSCRIEVLYYADAQFKLDRIARTYWCVLPYICSAQLDLATDRYIKIHGENAFFRITQPASENYTDVFFYSFVTGQSLPRAFEWTFYIWGSRELLDAIVAELKERGSHDVALLKVSLVGDYFVSALFSSDVRFYLTDNRYDNPGYAFRFADEVTCMAHKAGYESFMAITFGMKSRKFECIPTQGGYRPFILALYDRTDPRIKWNIDYVPTAGNCLDNREAVAQFYDKSLNREVGFVACDMGVRYARVYWHAR